MPYAPWSMGLTSGRATDDFSGVAGRERVVGVGKRISARIYVQQKRPSEIGAILRRTVNDSAVMDGYRTGGSAKIRRFAGVGGGECIVVQAAHPLAVLVILVIQRSVVRSGNRAQRSLVRSAVMEQSSHRKRRIISVRPVTDILMPFYFLTTFRPLEIQFRVVEFYVWIDKIRGDIHEN